MRRSIGLVAAFASASLLMIGPVFAKETKGRVLNTTTKSVLTKKSKAAAGATTKAKTTPNARSPKIVTHENIPISADEKKKAASVQQKGTAEEQRVLGQVRGMQALLAKEEKLLAQRMAYAAKVRAQGLVKNDQKLLDQAEQFERAALAQYQKRVQQFESLRAAGSSLKPTVRRQPTRARSSSSYRRRSGR